MQFDHHAVHQLVVTHSAGTARFVAALTIAMGIGAGVFGANDLAFLAVALMFIFAGLWLMWRAPSAHHTFYAGPNRAKLRWRTVIGTRRELSLEFAQITDVIVAERKIYDDDKMHRIELLLHGGQRVPLTPYWLSALGAVEACAGELRRFTNVQRQPRSAASIEHERVR